MSYNCIKRSDVFLINFLEIPNITKNSFLGRHLSYFVLANIQLHRYDSFMPLNIKKYLIKSILKKTKISKTENNTESDRAGNGNVDDDNDSSDDIDNEGRDDDIVGGDTNDDSSDDDKSNNEGGDSNDEGGGDGGNNGGDNGDNDDSNNDEVDRSNKDVGLDNVNAGDGENKVGHRDMYRGSDSNDDVGVDDVGGVNTNRGVMLTLMVIANLIVMMIETTLMVMMKIMVVLMMVVMLTLILVMMLTVVMAGAKFIAVKIHLVLVVIVMLMVVNLVNEVNFNICYYNNTKWKTRCKVAKIALRIGYLGICYFRQNL